MGGLDAGTVAALPPEFRALLYILILAATVFGGLRAWGASARAPKETTGKDLMVTAGGFVDMEPVRDLAAQVMGLTKIAEMAYREGKTCGPHLECIAEELPRLTAEMKHIGEILSRMAEEDRVNNQLTQRRGP